MKKEPGWSEQQDEDEMTHRRVAEILMGFGLKHLVPSIMVKDKGGSVFLKASSEDETLKPFLDAYTEAGLKYTNPPSTRWPAIKLVLPEGSLGGRLKALEPVQNAAINYAVTEAVGEMKNKLADRVNLDNGRFRGRVRDMISAELESWIGAARSAETPAAKPGVPEQKSVSYADQELSRKYSEQLDDHWKRGGGA